MADNTSQRGAGVPVPVVNSGLLVHIDTDADVPVPVVNSGLRVHIDTDAGVPVPVVNSGLRVHNDTDAGVPVPVVNSGLRVHIDTDAGVPVPVVNSGLRVHNDTDAGVPVPVVNSGPRVHNDTDAGVPVPVVNSGLLVHIDTDAGVPVPVVNSGGPRVHIDTDAGVPVPVVNSGPRVHIDTDAGVPVPVVNSGPRVHIDTDAGVPVPVVNSGLLVHTDSITAAATGGFDPFPCSSCQRGFLFRGWEGPVLMPPGPPIPTCPICGVKPLDPFADDMELLERELPGPMSMTWPPRIDSDRERVVRQKTLGLINQLAMQHDIMKKRVDQHVKARQEEAKAKCSARDDVLQNHILQRQRQREDVRHLTADMTKAVSTRNATMMVGADRKRRKLMEAVTFEQQRFHMGTVPRHCPDLDKMLCAFLGKSRLLGGPVGVRGDEDVRMLCSTGERVRSLTPFPTGRSRWNAVALCGNSSQRGRVVSLTGGKTTAAWLTRNVDFTIKPSSGQVIIAGTNPTISCVLPVAASAHPVASSAQEEVNHYYPNWLQVSKSAPEVCLSRLPTGSMAVCSLSYAETESAEGQELEMTQAVANQVRCEINAKRPAAFDASRCGSLYVVLERARDSPDDCPSERDEVKMYVAGQRQAVSTYRPERLPFCPTDVCFWEERGEWELKLLIADWHRDVIHVVVVTAGSSHMRFERHLAAGAGDMVKPCALNTDPFGDIWIGCSNGSVLHHKTLGDENDAEMPSELYNFRPMKLKPVL